MSNNDIPNKITYMAGVALQFKQHSLTVMFLF